MKVEFWVEEGIGCIEVVRRLPDVDNTCVIHRIHLDAVYGSEIEDSMKKVKGAGASDKQAEEIGDEVLSLLESELLT